MIIFFDKESGEIKGTIEGRIHSEEELNMFVGDPETTQRWIVEWKQDSQSGDFYPEHSQRETFMDIDKNPGLVYTTKVQAHPETGELLLVPL